MSFEKEPNEVLFEGDYLRVVKKDGWETIERNNASGVVIIYPITNDDKLVLVEQFRRPIGKACIEWPAGLVGDKSNNKDPEVAAIHELEEETGYRANIMRKVFSGTVSPGLSNEITDCFIATNLEKISFGGGNKDEKENIKVHEVHIDDFENWIKNKELSGTIIDIKVWLGYYVIIAKVFKGSLNIS